MNKVSIRQPLVLYAMVFMILIAFIVLTLASFSMVRASRRAYQRATAQELRALVSDRSLERIRELTTPESGDDELSIGVVTATASPFSLDLAGARQAALTPSGNLSFVVVPIAQPGVESYLVARLDPTIPTSIAFVEISRMVPLVLVGALACAAALAFLIGRLLLPPLDALAEVANDPRATDATSGLEQSGAPTEVHEVAQRFRKTIRLLNEERDLVQAQRDELERMQESLVRASKLASVGRLAAGIAHEVGNPLAAVKGYLSIMRSGLEEPERSEVLERSVRELDRIHETIQKLLTYARRGEATSEPLRPLSTRQVVDEAVALVRGHPSLHGVQIVTDVEGEGEDATGHAGRLNQVIVNLLLNAAHAVASVHAPRVEVRRTREDGAIVLRVIDNGPGIDPDHLDSIFDPFFTTKEPGEGTGLGLAVSRALMEAMHGDLRAISESGRGATFEVKLQTVSSTLPD